MHQGGEQAQEQETGGRPYENRIGLDAEEIEPGNLKCGLRRNGPARHGASTEEVVIENLNRRRTIIRVQGHSP